MAEEHSEGATPSNGPDAASGPRRSTFRPPAPGPSAGGAAPPLPPWLDVTPADPGAAEPVAPEPVVPAPVAPEPVAPVTASGLGAVLDPATGAIVLPLTAQQLAAALDASLGQPGGALKAIEQFEQQLRIRGIASDSGGSGDSGESADSSDPSDPSDPSDSDDSDDAVAVEHAEPVVPDDAGHAVVGEPEPLPTPAPARGFVELAPVAPTPDDLRVGRAARMFWLWFPVNASLVMVAIGATLLEPNAGLRQSSLRQAVLAALLGVAFAFIPIGFATMAAKRASQPTMIVSRAVFGHLGNVIPVLIALLTRLAIAGLLVVLAAAAVAGIVTGASGGVGQDSLALPWIVVVTVAVLVVGIAVVGYRLVVIVQLVLTVLSLAGIVGLIAATAHRVDLAVALQRQDGPWLGVVGGGVLVFSVVGLAWAMSGGDLARYQRSSSGSTGALLLATFGATLPPFVLIGYGALLAASDDAVGVALATDPVAALIGILPGWTGIALLVVVAGAFVSGAVLALYSAGLAVQAIGASARRPTTTAIAAIGVVIAAIGFTAASAAFTASIVTTVVVVAAVPVAAWTGILAGDVMTRWAPYDLAGLLRRGGRVPDVVWGNLLGLLALTAIGWGLVSGPPGTGWLLPLFASEHLAASAIGVPVALVLGIVVGVLVGVNRASRDRARDDRGDAAESMTAAE